MDPLKSGGLVPAGNLSIKKTKLPEIVISKKSIGYDYQKDMESMFKAAEGRQEGTANLALSNLELGNVSLAIGSFSVGGSWQGLSILSESEQLVEQAKKLISEKEFQQALPLLEKALQVGPNQEIIYLKAYCLAELDKAEEALVCIVPLRQANLAVMLQARLDVLKNMIRVAMRQQLFQEIFVRKLLGEALGISGEQNRHLLTRLQSLSNLDPEESLYHFLLGAKLLEFGLVRDALVAINRGLREATTGDREQLENFHHHVEGLYILELVQPAVQSCKQKAYRRGRDELQRIEAPYRADPRVAAFDGYLDQLERKPPKAGQSLPRPTGTGEMVKDLYQFLVSKDIEQAERLVHSHNFEGAIALLRQARPYAAEYPRINFLLARNVYMWGHIQYLLVNDRIDKKEMIQHLQEVVPYAKIAGQDDEDGPDLLKALEQFIKRLTQEQKADAFIETYTDIMSSTEGGIRDVQTLRTVHQYMRALDKDLTKASSEPVDDDIRGLLQQLSKVVKANLDQLQRLEEDVMDQEQDAERLNRLRAQYEQIMEQAGNIQSPEQLDNLHTQMGTLKRAAAAAHNELRSSEALRALASLQQKVEARLGELEVLRRQVRQQEADKDVIGPRIQEFNEAMEYYKQNPISSPTELNQAREYFLSMHINVTKAKSRVTSAESRQALDQLEKTIDSILKQMRGK